jgi:putative transcriptional regulator
MADNSAGGRMRIVIEIRLDELLEEQERSFYWLAKETGISHTTLWRLKKGKALGINFDTLEKVCLGLNCQPGDVLKLASEKKAGKKRAAVSRRGRR